MFYSVYYLLLISLFLKIPHMRRINPTILNSRIDASNLNFFKIFKIDKPAQYAVLFNTPPNEELILEQHLI